MSWKEKLLPSVAALVQEIVDQVPEKNGVRTIFEQALNDLSASDPIKFRFIIVTEGDVQGTNDEDRALELSNEADVYVIDTANSTWVLEEGEENSDITELK